MEERMKKQVTVVSVLLLSLFLAFLIMSCSPGSQNSNQTNANTVTNSTPRTTQCSDSEITTEMDKIIKNNGIENQHNGNGNPKHIKYFEYYIANDGDKKILLIEGGISDGNGPNTGGNHEFMEKVIKAIDQLVTHNCVFKAEFVKYGTTRLLREGKIKLSDVQGFDWSVCEWPKIACPGGECLDSCPGMEVSNANMPAATPGNSNANSPANSNSNANANANRAP
jgi:hypothetical protein